MDEGALGCGLGDWQGSVIGKIQRLARGCEAAFASFALVGNTCTANH